VGDLLSLVAHGPGCHLDVHPVTASNVVRTPFDKVPADLVPTGVLGRGDQRLPRVEEQVRPYAPPDLPELEAPELFKADNDVLYSYR
jgi:hypothetical protein